MYWPQDNPLQQSWVVLQNPYWGMQHTPLQVTSGDQAPSTVWTLSKPQQSPSVEQVPPSGWQHRLLGVHPWQVHQLVVVPSGSSGVQPAGQVPLVASRLLVPPQQVDEGVQAMPGERAQV